MSLTNFEKAIRKLAERGSLERSEEEDLIQVVYEEVEPLCKTSTGGPDDTQTHLYDWLDEGDYVGNETPQGIADEWDELEQL
jgi:hypothetical protein